MRLKRCSLGCLWLLSVPGTSLAHSPIEGIGGLYNGLLHPVLVPAHLLLIIAVGLFLGQQGLKRVEIALGFFAGATVLGLTMAWFAVGEGMEVLVLILSAALGLLVAIKKQMALHWCAIIAVLAGFALGIDSTQENLLGNERFLALFGSGIAIYFLVLYPTSLADKFNEKDWQKIGIRILGSWVAASSLLVLAFTFAPKP